MQTIKSKDTYIQALRGLAICAVVLIHVLPAEPYAVAVRPFVNFPVALFIFLSGLLTTPEKVTHASSFIARRAVKILPPYFVWTCVYLVLFGPFTFGHIAKGFVLGASSAQMYYLVVYLQLVLLTPLILKLLKNKVGRATLYLVTPVCLAARYALHLSGHGAMSLHVFAGTWLVFYLVGLEWKARYAAKLADTRHGLLAVAAVTAGCLALQELEGAFWYGQGSFEFAMTQLKLTTAVTSLAFVALVMALPRAAKDWLGCRKSLVWLGDVSFGLYLCHMVFVDPIKALLPAGGLWFVVAWLLVLALASLTVVAFRRLLPQKALRILGF